MKKAGRLKNRHKLADCAEKVIKTVADNLNKLTHKVSSHQSSIDGGTWSHTLRQRIEVFKY